MKDKSKFYKIKLFNSIIALIFLSILYKNILVYYLMHVCVFSYWSCFLYNKNTNKGRNISNLFCWFNFLDMKAVKKLYDRRQEEKIYILYFAFISGFNNHSVGEKIIPEYK